MEQKSNQCLELYNAALNNFKSIIELMDDNLREQLSTLDKQQNDLLHIVENEGTMNVYTQYDLMVDLREIRRARRDVKNMLELSELVKQPITELLNKHELLTLKFNQVSDLINNPIYKIKDENIYDKYVDYGNQTLQLKSDEAQVKK